MKMNKIIAPVIAFLGSSVLLSGCIQETFPEGGSVTLDQKQNMPTFEDPAAALSTILITNQISGISDHYNFGYPGMLAALDRATGEVFPVCETIAGGNAAYDRFYPWQRIELGWYSATGAPSRFFYENYYAFIKTTNDAILLASGNEEMATTLGVSKAFRAMYYLDMARLYDPLPVKAGNGPRGATYLTEMESIMGLTVPLSREDMVLEQFEDNPRMTREEIFTFIFEDLDVAEELLADFTPERKNVPSLAVVHGLRARVYLWLGGFTEGTGAHPNGAAAYRLAAEYARKAITASGASMMTEAEWTSTSNGFNTVVSSWMFAMIQSTATVRGNLHSWSAHQVPEALWGYGSGSQPGISISSYNRMNNTDFRKKLIVPPSRSYEDFKPYTTLTEEEFNGGGEAMGVIAPMTFFKFRGGGGEKYSDVTGNVTSIPLMRVEEMYLIEAEATAHYDAPAGKSLLEAFMTKRATQYSVPAGADLIDEIIFQKRIEFWGEGLTFYDFKRLNMSIRNGDEGSNAPSGTRFSTDGRAPWWNLVLPLSSSQLNKAMENKNNPNPVGTYTSIEN